MSDELLSPAAFAAAIAADLGLSDVPALDASLVDEIGLDSFDMVTLVVLIETLAQTDSTQTSPPTWMTLGDAYDRYRQVVVDRNLERLRSEHR